MLSSGAGADVGNGGPETANSWLWLVLSRGPSPEGNSIGSFHRVGSGSWGLSAAKSKLDSRAQVVCGEGCQLSPPDHLAGKFTPCLEKRPHVTQNTYRALKPEGRLIDRGGEPGTVAKKTWIALSPRADTAQPSHGAKAESQGPLRVPPLRQRLGEASHRLKSGGQPWASSSPSLNL